MKRMIPAATSWRIVIAVLIAAAFLWPATVSAQDVVDPPPMLVAQSVPDEGHAPPYYARIWNVEFQAEDWVTLVFYRNPSCVPADFNLSAIYDFPSEAGPGAFGCEAKVAGYNFVEPEATPLTFPWAVLLEGTGDVPIWILPLSDYLDLTSDGGVTVERLSSVDPLIGSANRFHEVLHPRDPARRIDMFASGTLEDGRNFYLQVTSRPDKPGGREHHVFLEIR